MVIFSCYLFWIENYVHEESYAVSSSHYGKKQSTLLVATVHYIDNKNSYTTRYFDFVSSYLSHNHIFYEKCYQLLMTELIELISRKITRIINVTDGGNHFVSKYAFWILANLSNTKSIFMELIN